MNPARGSITATLAMIIHHHSLLSIQQLSLQIIYCVFSSSITSFDHNSTLRNVLQLPIKNESINLPSFHHSTFTSAGSLYKRHWNIADTFFMIWGGFFNQRHKIRSGAKAAYRIVMKRELTYRDSRKHQRLSTIIEWRCTNHEFRRSVFRQRSGINTTKNPLTLYTKIRKRFAKNNMKILWQKNWMQLDSLLEGHENLQKNLKTHPPTEVQLSAERLKKERWYDGLEGWGHHQTFQ